MINFKKAAFTFCLGLGLASTTLTANAGFSFCGCYDMLVKCHAGDERQCYNFNRLRCYATFPDVENGAEYCA